MRQFIEEFDVFPSVWPIDLEAAANDGKWASAEGFHYLSMLFIGNTGGTAAGTAAENPVLTFSQATAADGSGSKPLNVSLYWLKQPTGSNEFIESKTYGWTRNDLSPSTNVITLTDSAQREKMAVFDFRDSALDVDNGFRWVQCSIADTGAEFQVGTAVWIGRRYRMTGDQDIAAKL